MSYKFQRGDAILSGALMQEGNVELASGFEVVIGNASLSESELEMLDGITAGTVSASKAVVVDANKDADGFRNISGSTLLEFGAASLGSDLTVGADVILPQGGNVYLTGDGGSAKIASNGGNALNLMGAKAVFNGSSIEPDTDAGTDLGSSTKEFKDLYLDGVAYIDSLQADQLGAALDANSQAITNINVDSGAIDGTIIGANSVAAGSFAALVGTTGTFSGVLKTDDATEATSTTDGSLQTDGGLSVAKSAVIGDDLDLLSDAAILNFGADKDVNLTHVADTGLLLNSSMQMQFGDSGTYIHQSADGVLDLVSDTEIEINATTVDINGAIDASSTIVAASSITAGTSFVIGSADLNEADMEKLDGITNGTAAASKAVVLDANKDVAGLRDVSGRKATLSSLTQGRLVTAGASGLLEDQGELVYSDDRSGQDGYLTLAVSSSASGSANLQDGSIQILDESENPQLWIYKDTAMIPAAGDAAMVVADSLYFFDATDNTMKREAVGDFSTLIAGDGLGVASSQLKLDLNELTAASINVANDSIVLIDADDSNKSKKESVVDFMTAAAGTGLAAASGQLKLSLDELSDAAVASGDKFAFVDATDDSSKLESIDDMATFFAGNGLAAASGVLALDVNELSQAAVADGDFIVIEDATDNSTKKEAVADLASLFAGAGLAAASSVIAVANATNGGIGVQANDIKLDMNDLAAGAVDVSADSIAIVDADDSSKTKKESIADLVSAMAGAGLSASSGVLSVSGNDVALKANSETLVEGYNYFAAIGGSDSSATVTLPAAPSVGDVVTVKAGSLASGKTITINKAGSQTIDGETSIVIESSYGAVSLVYVVNNDWRIV